MAMNKMKILAFQGAYILEGLEETTEILGLKYKAAKAFPSPLELQIKAKINKQD